MNDKQVKYGLDSLHLEFGKNRVDDAFAAVQRFKLEIPGWIFGAFGGGRFGEYMPPGCARNIYEKLDDAAFVHKLTGATEQVAMHVLWDFSEDGYSGDYKTAENVNKAARDRGIRIGSISPTCFLKGSFRGSLSAMEAETRERYIEQSIFAAEIAKEHGCNLLTIWLPDGSMYPGQIELIRAYENTRQSLHTIREKIDKDILMLIEYKVFEPGTYSTVISDWGTAFTLVKSLGDNTGVLIDLGHHHHGTNIEQIVAYVIAQNMKAGFHFNTRYAADDDHAVEPNGEMARVFYELVRGQVVANKRTENDWAYMIDQCSSRENRLHAILHSIDSLQLSLAKALLVDRNKLEDLQRRDEIILANRIFNNALLHADVRPIVAAARLENNLPVDPVSAFVDSGYQQKIESQRS